VLTPLLDRVLIRPDEPIREIGGVLLPDVVIEHPNEGIIVAVGPGRYEYGGWVPVELEVGQRVLFSKYGYAEVEDDGEMFLLIGVSDLLAVRS
jgi:chaperonin GroES